MTKEEVLLAIKDIEDSGKVDDQVAHEKDDALRERFIQFVALREDALGEIAKLLLTTNSINFCRWYS